METTARVLVGAALATLIFSKVLELTEQDHTFNSCKAIVNRQARFEAHNVVRGQQLGMGLEYFLNKVGMYIHFRRWTPLANVHPFPKGVVILVHGLGEHVARYAHVALALNQIGFVVYGLDHQGHGRSEGDRLHLESFGDYVDDVLDLTALAKRENTGLPVFLFGHSMGGMIAIHTLQRAQSEFTGAVLSGPPIVLDNEPPALVLQLLHAISAVFPKLPLDGLPLDSLANHKPIVDLYFNDPLVHHGKIPARLLSEMANAIVSVKPEQITLPYVLIHGKGDKICIMRGSEEFHGKTKSTDKVFHQVEGGHESLNELDGGALKLVVNWLKERI